MIENIKNIPKHTRPDLQLQANSMTFTNRVSICVYAVVMRYSVQRQSSILEQDGQAFGLPFRIRASKPP